MFGRPILTQFSVESDEGADLVRRHRPAELEEALELLVCERRLGNGSRRRVHLLLELLQFDAEALADHLRSPEQAPCRL